MPRAAATFGVASIALAAAVFDATGVQWSCPVSCRVELQVGGAPYTGTVNAAGTVINGTLPYLGVDIRFEGTKAQ